MQKRLVAALFIAACGAPPSVSIAPTGTRTQSIAATDINGTSLPAKTLALTFDDGPGAHTAELSTYLASRGIRATFFVNGTRIAATTLTNPRNFPVTDNATDILAQLLADGHLVANHATTHSDLLTEVLADGADKVVQELEETDTSIAPYMPPGIFLFRTPYGSYGQGVYDALKDSAMNKYIGPIGFDIGAVPNNFPSEAADYACWLGYLENTGGGLANGDGYATYQECGDAYMTAITAADHGIVLMHDPYEDRPGDNAFEMVKYMVPLLEAAGYSFVRVDEVPEVAALLPPPAPPGPPGATGARNATGPTGPSASQQQPVTASPIVTDKSAVAESGSPQVEEASVPTTTTISSRRGCSAAAFPAYPLLLLVILRRRFVQRGERLGNRTSG